MKTSAGFVAGLVVGASLMIAPIFYVLLGELRDAD